MDVRLGVIAIIVERERQSAAQVNEILSQFASCIRARMGVPDVEEDMSAIAVIVQLTTGQLGALTGRLGRLPGVTVKSVLTNHSAARPNDDAAAAAEPKGGLDGKQEDTTADH